MDTQPKNAGGGNVPGKKAAVDADDKPHQPHMLPVWFFIGVELVIYGVLILGEGLVQFRHPPDTVLANLHPAVWWGALLLALGVFYTWTYRPGKN